MIIYCVILVALWCVLRLLPTDKKTKIDILIHATVRNAILQINHAGRFSLDHPQLDHPHFFPRRILGGDGIRMEMGRHCGQPKMERTDLGFDTIAQFRHHSMHLSLILQPYTHSCITPSLAHLRGEYDCRICSMAHCNFQWMGGTRKTIVSEREFDAGR